MSIKGGGGRRLMEKSLKVLINHLVKEWDSQAGEEPNSLKYVMALGWRGGGVKNLMHKHVWRVAKVSVGTFSLSSCFFLRKLDESVQMVIRRSNSDPSPNHIESEKTFEKTNQQETVSERSRISGFL